MTRNKLAILGPLTFSCCTFVSSIQPPISKTPPLPFCKMLLKQIFEDSVMFRFKAKDALHCTSRKFAEYTEDFFFIKITPSHCYICIIIYNRACCFLLQNFVATITAEFQCMVEKSSLQGKFSNLPYLKELCQSLTFQELARLLLICAPPFHFSNTICLAERKQKKYCFMFLWKLFNLYII